MVVCCHDVQGVTPYNLIFFNYKPEPLLHWFQYFPIDQFFWAERYDKTFNRPFISTSFSALMVVFLSPCHHNLIHGTTPLILYILTLCLHHCIFPCITNAVLIPMPLPWYPFHQWGFHHNNCLRYTYSVSITLWIIFCICHPPPPSPMPLYP